MSYNPEHHDEMKRVERRHYFVRDMVENFEIEVPFVRTDDNCADMLTKPMKSASKFFAFRAVIMNEPTVLAAIAASTERRSAPVSLHRSEPTSQHGGASVSNTAHHKPHALCSRKVTNCVV